MELKEKNIIYHYHCNKWLHLYNRWKMSPTRFLRNGIFHEVKSLSPLDSRMWSGRGAWQALLDFFGSRFIPCLQSVVDPCQPCAPGMLQRSNPSPCRTGHFLRPTAVPAISSLRALHNTPGKCWFRACLFVYVHNRPWYSHPSLLHPPLGDSTGDFYWIAS